MGCFEKRRAVKNLIAKHKPALFFIQETKLRQVDDSVIRSLGGNFLTKAITVNSEGVAGGLISLWNEDFFLVKACISNQRCIILVGELVKLKKDIVFCNIYASSKENEKEEMWDFIVTAQQSLDLPWCIGGDFNSVLKLAERKGVTVNRSAMMITSDNGMQHMRQMKCNDLGLVLISEMLMVGSPVYW